MPFDKTSFAAERSHDTAKAANENSRPMAQYALIINGAAASALIAFLSKENINVSVLATAPWSLISYALGVVFGVIAMFCMTESLDYYSDSWRFTAFSQPGADHQHALGLRCWWVVRFAVGFSIAFFVVGSGALAIALMYSTGRAPMPCVFPPG
jgi:hypothetical protein